MRLVDRYITKNVLGAVALITVMLTGLQVFILLVNQLDDIGKGNYGVLQALIYVLYQMPYQVYLFFPIASLLGCLIGLGMMANYRELVVMRAAGMSIGQVSVAVMKAAFIIIIIVTIIGETIVPSLAEIGSNYRLQSLSKGQTIRTPKGVWLRNKLDYISIGEVTSGTLLEQVYQFKFDETHHLRVVRQIDSVKYDNGQWLANGVNETVINDKSTKARFVKNLLWDVPLKPNILQLTNREPEEMTLIELKRYLRIQKKINQTEFNYQLSFWQRLVQPFTTLVMMMLAIPFIFGPLRGSTIGSKFLIGSTVGFGFYIFNRFFGPISYVFQFSPEMAAVGPTVIFAILGIFLMRRAR